LRDFEQECKKCNLKTDSTWDEYNLSRLMKTVNEQSQDINFLGKYLLNSFQKVQNAEFVYDNPAVKNSEPSPTVECFKKLLTSARQSLIIQSPYFVLDNFLKNLLGELTNRTSAIDILVSTNSLAAT